MKKIISVILLVVFCLSLFGCEYINEWIEKNDDQNIGESDETGDIGHNRHDLFPDGYTGGFYHQPGANIEYWWVETYEEVIEAIELLKSHGSTFSQDPSYQLLLTYEGDLFDVKYCFTIAGVGGKTEKIKWGDNPFDRHAENVKINSYAFFEDVTIDEINHSYITNRHTRYKAYIYGINNAVVFDNSIPNELVIGEWREFNKTDKGDGNYAISVCHNEQKAITISTCFYLTEDEVEDLKMTEECINALIHSSKVIDLRIEE